MLVGMVVFTAGSIWALSQDLGAWLGWLGLALFGVGGAFFAYRQLRLGTLTGGPALVLGRDELGDRATGQRVRWDEIEGLELWEMSVRGSTQRWLGLWVSDPDAVYEQIGGLRGALNELVLPGRPPVDVSLNLLAVSPEALVGLLRRFWQGPIRGEPVAAAGPRRSRLRRFLGWLGA